MAEANELLPWQKGQFDRLRRLHNEGRLGHAWLLAGLQGTGKLQFARFFAQSQLCSDLQEDRPCGQCKNCVLFIAGSHPDYRLLQAEKKLITIDQIRDSIDFMQTTSALGEMKILVIDPAEAMNANAANALLKLLEEPPDHTLIMMTTHQPGVLLATLRSRCQLLRFPLPQTSEATAWLQRQGMNADVAELLYLAGGAPMRALAMREDDPIGQRKTLIACLDAMLTGDMQAVEAAKKCEKFSIIATIDYLLGCVSALSRKQQADMDLLDVELATLSAQPVFAKTNQQAAAPLHAIYSSLMQARKFALASNNANPQLMLEALFVQWRQLEPSVRKQG